MKRAIGSPRHLSAEHDVSHFQCGVPELDDWLKRRARQNDANGASRTFVVTAGSRVIGYYALATGGVSHEKATGRVRRNMPEPIPVMLLARLAVDREYQDKGLGVALLRDALLRTLRASEVAGIRAVLLHAVDESSKRFYLHHGFFESPMDPMMLMITLAAVERSLPG
jgi:GNAT superfamily N-acetyltransferase